MKIYGHEIEMALLISEPVLQCLGDFQAASYMSPELGYEAHQKFLDEFARFKLWAGNIGAHRKGRSSLDWRLRDASHLRDLVIDLLTDLKSILRDFLSMLRKTPHVDQNHVTVREGSPNLNGLDKVEDDTEVLEVIADIADTIGCLLRLAVSIRNPAPHDHFMSSKLGDTSYFEEHDVKHVEAKLLRIKPALAHRLGKAISQRRQYFKYRETHHQKLKAELDTYLARLEAEVQSTVASSIPNELEDHGRGQPAFSGLEEEEISNSGGSQTPYATFDPQSGRLTILPLPKQASDGSFECPFCYTILSVNSMYQWKRHIYADLRPYICLELDCTTPEQQYTRRSEWFSHMIQKHWRVFRCPYLCQEEDFTSPSDLEQHVRQSHPELSSLGDLSMIFNLCGRPRPWPDETECPLCQQVLRSRREYALHVGQHQVELALFALPHTGEDDKEEDEDDSDHSPNQSDSEDSELGNDELPPQSPESTIRQPAQSTLGPRDPGSPPVRLQRSRSGSQRRPPSSLFQPPPPTPPPYGASRSPSPNH
ncbi:hypothetical protein F4859DRAFT_283498 [Xylaria cf. heliscus]|nr:hypothetical protein F4859DRAFT_283498 [Xylaria cf. heliscus]